MDTTFKTTKYDSLAFHLNHQRNWIGPQRLEALYSPGVKGGDWEMGNAEGIRREQTSWLSGLWLRKQLPCQPTQLTKSGFLSQELCPLTSV